MNGIVAIQPRPCAYKYSGFKHMKGGKVCAIILGRASKNPQRSQGSGILLFSEALLRIQNRKKKAFFYYHSQRFRSMVFNREAGPGPFKPNTGR